MSTRRLQLFVIATLAIGLGQTTADARPASAWRAQLGRVARRAGLSRPRVLYARSSPPRRWGVVQGLRRQQLRVAVVTLGAAKPVLLLPARPPKAAKVSVAVKHGYLGHALVRVAVSFRSPVGARTTFHIFRAPPASPALDLACTIDGSWHSEAVRVRQRGAPPLCGGFGKSTVRIVAVARAKLPTLQVSGRGYAGNAVVDGSGGCLRRSPIRFEESRQVQIPTTGQCTTIATSPRAAPGPPAPAVGGGKPPKEPGQP